MFEKWGFLLSEIWGLLALAALIGLFAGWLIFSRRKVEVVDTSVADGLRAELGRCKARGDALEAAAREAEASAKASLGRIAELEAALAEAGGNVQLSGRVEELEEELAGCQRDGGLLGERIATLEADLAACRAAPPAAPLLPVTEATRPASLTAARDGKPDDLKLIKGVGPVLEELCHKLGYYHFDQIAAWTAAEIAWVDDNLEGFKGRVTRDEWVDQARDLANGLPPRAGGEH